MNTSCTLLDNGTRMRGAHQVSAPDNTASLPPRLASSQDALSGLVRLASVAFSLSGKDQRRPTPDSDIRYVKAHAPHLLIVLSEIGCLLIQTSEGPDGEALSRVILLASTPKAPSIQECQSGSSSTCMRGDPSVRATCAVLRYDLHAQAPTSGKIRLQSAR